MTTELATRDEAQLMTALRTSLYPGASDASIAMVRSYTAAAGLDPMLKPVHIVAVWDSKAKSMRDVVMPGIGLYRTIAARTGCMGIGEPEFGPERKLTLSGVEITFPEWCKVTVKRLVNNKIAEFTARELWIENYAVKGGQEKSIAPNAMWTKRPYGQIAKCAEAQALRKAFPEVGAQPTAEEMEGKSIDGEYTVVEDKPAVSQPREKVSVPPVDVQDQSPAAESVADTTDGIHGLFESQLRILDVRIKAARTTREELLKRYRRIDPLNINEVLSDLRALADAPQ